MEPDILAVLYERPRLPCGRCEIARNDRNYDPGNQYRGNNNREIMIVMDARES